MKIQNYLILLLSFSIIFTSCNRSKHEEFGKKLAKAFKSKKYKNFVVADYDEVFNVELEKIKLELHNPKWIDKIYTEDDNGLILSDQFLPTGGIDTLKNYLERAKYHGLNPSYFHADQIAILLDSIKSTKFKDVKDTYPLIAKLELYAADGLVNYANILKYGAVNPKQIQPKYYVSIERPDYLDAEKTLDSLNLYEVLADVQPKNGYYQRLQNILINDDKSETKLAAEEKEKIFLSMERLRWPVEEYKGKYLLVNIPEYQLRLIENNTTNLKMKVCVGERGGHETPILSGLINHMQVNPVWNIPQSIATNEILVKLKSDPSYLEANDMVAYKGGQLVESHEVDWSSAQPGEYSFKQNPGADNSLGQIKFLFHNPYAIYLHDTPAQSKFNEEMRAVSHGCVRVEKPMELAKFLLQDKSETERIIRETDAATRGEQVTARWVDINHPVPVFIAYYTAWTNDDGSLITSEDVYGYDRLLKNKLKTYMAI